MGDLRRRCYESGTRLLARWHRSTRICCGGVLVLSTQSYARVERNLRAKNLSVVLSSSYLAHAGRSRFGRPASSPAALWLALPRATTVALTGALRGEDSRGVFFLPH